MAKEVEWGRRENVKITDNDGGIIYQAKNLEFPVSWNDGAVRITASKYFYVGDDKTNPIETSLKQLTHRVIDTISNQAVKRGVVKEEERQNFYDGLTRLVVEQKMAFNSPVWFNVGLFDQYGVKEKKSPNEEPSHWAVDESGNPSSEIDAYERPQTSACFIQSIGDNMPSILGHVKKEGMLFKYGSGTGTNFSTLRAANEPLSGGGSASGMISYMRIYDVGAGRIQSGGKTRRAAKMVICSDDHPDLVRFLMWKVNEEKKALWLCAKPEWGPRDPYDLDSEAYKTVDGQNGNNSVRLTDEFMEAALDRDDWNLHYRTANRFKEEREVPLEKYKDDRQLPDKRFLKKVTNKRKIVNAGEVFDLIARAAYAIGDPGVQFDTTINKWHTCPESGRINASNPCSEYMFLDDTACNLASLNLLEYQAIDEENLPRGHQKTHLERKLNNTIIDIPEFEKSVESTIRAQETLVEFSSYPSPTVALNSKKYRALGLGYANLGALLMSMGLAYDSEEGRAVAGAITSLMTAKAYETSADMAQELGAFEEFEKNKEPMLNVLKMHREAMKDIPKVKVNGLEAILQESEKVWERAIQKGERYGYRNSQVTLLAPTGTIGFMMGVDCTGVEPMTGIVTSKGLAGGGKMDLINQSVERGLRNLGYNEEQIKDINSYLTQKDEKGKSFLHTEIMKGVPHIKEEHYPIFATSLGMNNTISIDGHLKMMAAVQPFLSGAISKTVNLSKGATIEDVKNTYIKAWQLGLKSVTPYVDGSKGIQPVTINTMAKDGNGLKWGQRKELGARIDRKGWNVHIGNTGVHFMIGEYNDRPPKESPADFFVEFGGSGSPFKGIYTSWAKEASWNRQRGESLEEFIKHNLGATGTINGFTDHPFIKKVSSIEDLCAKIVMLEYFGDTSMCDKQPTPEDIEDLRCNELARNRRVEHFRSRINFIDKVINEGKVGEIYPLYQDELQKGQISMADVFCRICGTPTILSGANCRKCPNCGDASGCG